MEVGRANLESKEYGGNWIESIRSLKKFAKETRQAFLPAPLLVSAAWPVPSWSPSSRHYDHLPGPHQP